MRTLLALTLLLAACASTPNDDPEAYAFDTKRPWTVRATEPTFVAPSLALPKEVRTMASKNNVAITYHDGRLFMAFRSSNLHFASEHTRMFIVSSGDDGKTFRHEHTVALGSDVREPLFVSFGSKLRFFFFQAGTNPLAFEPKAIMRTEWMAPGHFSDNVAISGPEEVPWDVKVRKGRVWMTSYKGNHYQGGVSSLDVSFKVSDDGENFVPVNAERPVVYHGGVSEVAFEFDRGGNLWGVTRNEDGDPSGFGAHVCFAPAAALAEWECSEKSFPERYDSPRMFRHGDEIFLVARRDPEGVYDVSQSEVFENRRIQNLLGYSSRKKRTALYRLNQETRTIEHVFDLPGVGDTCFPSIHRLDAHRFLLANYTSPLDSDPPWFEGQTSERGTQIYLTTLVFE